VTRAAAILVAALVVAAPRAHAEPAGATPSPPVLEIDDCKQTDLSTPEIFKQGSEHYQRGETLYVQGDYEGAVRELVYSYCLVPSFYSLLKDIGQAYERNLDYEQAVAYLERYVRAVPANAKRAPDSTTDPQQDKLNVARRVEVLKKLRAKISVESSPPGARITIANAAGVASRAIAGDTIEVLSGRYEMTTALDSYEPHTQTIDVRIGKPYTYFVPLVAEKGRLAMQVVPPDARIFLGDRMVGIGHIDLALERGTYTMTTEAPGWITNKRDVEVLANQVKHEQVELAPRPQFGRRQLIVFSSLAGAGGAAGLLSSFHNTALSGFGAVAGGAAGLVGSAFVLPEQVALGTSNLTITSGLGGGVLGGAVSALFTKRAEVIEPVVGASIAVTATAGYLLGDYTGLTTGDAALINSGVMWGSVAGGLLAVSFDPGHVVAGGLVLSGLGMGTVGGVLLQHEFGISRTHAALIDVGGVIGIIGGLAIESLAYRAQNTTGAATQEHLANFALGGMAIGLVGAGILTRNLDDPKIPVAPAITQAALRDGSSTPVYGVSGRW
jgi:hypothetical protein